MMADRTKWTEKEWDVENCGRLRIYRLPVNNAVTISVHVAVNDDGTISGIMGDIMFGKKYRQQIIMLTVLDNGTGANDTDTAIANAISKMRREAIKWLNRTSARLNNAANRLQGNPRTTKTAHKKTCRMPASAHKRINTRH